MTVVGDAPQEPKPSGSGLAPDPGPGANVALHEPRAHRGRHVRRLGLLAAILAAVALARDGYAAEYGGAVLNNSTATVTITASTVTGSVAGKTGGGIDNHVGGTLHVRDSSLTRNVAYESGSAVNNNRDGTVTVTNSTVADNSAAVAGVDDALVGAGAIANNAELDAIGTITVTSSQISDNSAGGGRHGAGISNDGGGVVNVDQSTFSKNRSSGNGGGIFNGPGPGTGTD